MATFRSKNRISRKDKKRVKKTHEFENLRQVSYFFGDNKNNSYEIAQEMFKNIEENPNKEYIEFFEPKEIIVTETEIKPL